MLTIPRLSPAPDATSAATPTRSGIAARAVDATKVYGSGDSAVVALDHVDLGTELAEVRDEREDEAVVVVDDQDPRGRAGGHEPTVTFRSSTRDCTQGNTHSSSATRTAESG